MPHQILSVNAKAAVNRAYSLVTALVSSSCTMVFNGLTANASNGST